MKCGICNDSNPTYTYIYLNGDTSAPLPVRDAGDLVTHKRQQHHDEWMASLQRRKDTKAVRERQERDYAQRRREAGVKAGRTVLFRWADEVEVEITATSMVAAYNLPGYRYPEPVAFGHYEGLKEHSARLQREAAAFLALAYETGSPVPQEDMDQVRAAMDAVRREED